MAGAGLTEPRRVGPRLRLCGGTTHVVVLKTLNAGRTWVRRRSRLDAGGIPAGLSPTVSAETHPASTSGEPNVTLTKINPPALPVPMGYTQVVATEGSRTIYVAGQVSVDVVGNVVAPGDVIGQARRAFTNVKSAVEAAGATVEDIAKVTWYVVGYRSELLPQLAAARRVVFGDHAPASTLIGVAALANPDYLIEVEAVAVIDAPPA
jgi:enamine deaminase RidA (YjgF/YER057c/UK114 family)